MFINVQDKLLDIQKWIKNKNRELYSSPNVLSFHTIYFISDQSIFFHLKILAPGSWALKIYWISHFTTVVLGLMITLVFWAALFPSKLF